ncbi:hypothetical protein ANN_21198 [Periplaneta americana]|uniref:Reverse transcriptase domain-containing protein n=1 Tax=Periplaneta americana TaxID=6978 RepID=A0ABQ8SFI0_PERAM|nr:hypothetical protein ANN_21198 [Periplaneta americana]
MSTKSGAEEMCKVESDGMEGVELNGLHQVLAFADDMIILGENPQTVRENMEILLEANKERGLEVNQENTKYMIMSRDQNIIRSVNIKLEIYPLKSGKFKYLGATRRKFAPALGSNPGPWFYVPSALTIELRRSSIHSTESNPSPPLVRICMGKEIFSGNFSQCMGAMPTQNCDELRLVSKFGFESQAGIAELGIPVVCAVAVLFAVGPIMSRSKSGVKRPPIDPDALKKVVEAVIAPPGNKISIREAYSGL